MLDLWIDILFLTLFVAMYDATLVRLQLMAVVLTWMMPY
jgi:hypothetical protein